MPYKFNPFTGKLDYYKAGGEGETHNLLSLLHPDTAPTSVAKGDIITGQGSPPKWTKMALGNAGTYLRSNGTDLLYSLIQATDLPSGIDASKIANGVVDNAEFQCLDGVTSSIQSQLNDKVNLDGDETINGVKTFNSFPLTPSTAPSSDWEVSNKWYVDQISLGMIPKEPVLDMDLTSPPSSPGVGDRYHVASAGSHPIIDVDQGLSCFSVSGNRTTFYAIGDIILVRLSTGNNGWYELVNVKFHAESNRTLLHVAETIPDSTPDGNIHYSNGNWRQIGVGKLVTWNGSNWISDGTPSNYWTVLSLDDNKQWRFWDKSIATYSWIQTGAAISYNFENGLTYSAGIVKLGGTLTQDTTLALGNYKTIFDITGSGYIGMGTTMPNSYLTIWGSKTEKINYINENITLGDTHHTILADAQGVMGVLEITLPMANSCLGREYTIKKIDNSLNIVRIRPNPSSGDRIDGAIVYDLTRQYDWLTIKSNGDIGGWCITDCSILMPHSSTHKSGGADAIKLDELALPDDNTNLDASTLRHGLLRKLSGNPNHYLDGQGNWTTPGSGSFAPIEAQYLTLTTNPNLTQERVLTAGNRISLTDAGANSAATLEIKPSYKYITLEDEFTSGLTSTGNIGALAWVLGAGSVTAKAGVTSHPGILTLSSSATSGTIGRLMLTTGTVLSWIPQDVSYTAMILRPISGTTAMSVRFGLSNNVATSGEGAQGIYFSFLPSASANWRTVTRDASDVTINTTAIAYTLNNWYLLEIIKTGSNYAFYLNNTLQFTHSTNIPTAGCIPFVAIETGEAVAKTIDIDYFSLTSINPLGQRWT